MHALGLEFGSAAQLSKRPGSVLNCLWGNALKRSPGIICKSRVSYPGPGFLSSATWPLLPKKHYNGLNQTKPNFSVIWKNYSKSDMSDYHRSPPIIIFPRRKFSQWPDLTSDFPPDPPIHLAMGCQPEALILI